MNKALIVTLIIALAVLSVPVAALTYEDMARYPDKNTGASITISGEVDQVIYEDEGWAVKMQTKKTEYGYFGNDLFVYFSEYPSNGRVLEDDMIQATGTFIGPYQYETVLGAVREVPLILGSSYVINPISMRY